MLQECTQGNFYARREKLVKLYCSMENRGSISLRVEKNSLQLTKFLKKVPELFFFPERQRKRKKTFKNSFSTFFLKNGK